MYSRAMARIPYVYEHDPATPPAAQEALEVWDRVFPDTFINLIRLLANDPPIAAAFSEFNRVIYTRPNLTPAEVELAYTTASVVNQCHY
jgi:hypothetical protein